MFYIMKVTSARNDIIKHKVDTEIEKTFHQSNHFSKLFLSINNFNVFLTSFLLLKLFNFSNERFSLKGLCKSVNKCLEITDFSNNISIRQHNWLFNFTCHQRITNSSGRSPHLLLF